MFVNTSRFSQAVIICCVIPLQLFAQQVYQDEYIVVIPKDVVAPDLAPGGDESPVGHEYTSQALGDGKRIALFRKGDSSVLDSLPGGTIIEYDQQEADSFCESLAKSVPYELCEPNAPLTANVLPNDEMYAELYGMDNIFAPAAWDLSTGSISDEVIVGVLDTGVDYSHEDLAENMWINTGEIPGNGLDDDQNGYVDDVYGYDFYNNDGDPYDDNGHGTHVAGTIGAVGNNGIGVTGVAWRTKIMALKFLAGSGAGSTLDAVTAIDFAVSHGVHILNASFGGTFPSTALQNAIKRADEAGVLFVAASGNSSKDTDRQPHYPSGYDIDSIISVAATDSSDSLAFFSNYGATSVDIAAPGVGIVSTVPGGYTSLSGTSMAAPHVAGLAALLLAYEQDLSSSELKSRILNSGDRLLSLQGLVETTARINAFGALSGETNGALPGLPIEDQVDIERFGHRQNSKVLFKRRNFRMLFQGTPGKQFVARLQLDGIFDGTCNLGTFTIPESGTLRLRSRLTLRGWMWYTRKITLETGSATLSRSVRRRRGKRYSRNSRFKRARALLIQQRSNDEDIGSRYTDLSCKSIVKTLRSLT